MLVIAHRGASFEAPENTLVAFERAIDAHADGIELDVMEVDGELFVFHDRYLRRLAAQPGRFQDLTSAQVRALRIFSQHPIPTLLEALEFIQGRCFVNIELKSQVSQAALVEVLNQAEQTLGFSSDQLIVSAFNHHWIHALKQSRPKTRIGALSASCLLDYARFANELDAYSLHIDIDFVTFELIQDAHQRGLKVFVYTVDEPEDILLLKRWGVGGLFTNHPRHTRNVIDGLTSASPFNF
ncbi:glycerophosphodiester phosphodiesterase [Aliidiomarina indica]|uniref:glycerophosphodiester phosphodiesterase n=1 Tax=Aliidiomarina indica TaxID=2749147 RepID=UPI00188E3811|nr:glycerophosphodiester phosphodiesterase [Aliidiomarina indica]